MRLIPDKSGRFRYRPYYDVSELDGDCERTILSFMRERCGSITFPISTDVLTKLVEREASDLDLFSDLTGEGHDVEGVTDFFRDRAPRVRISRELSELSRHEHRLRTTLTHEYGHVRFHGEFWKIELMQGNLFSNAATNLSPRCRRQRIVGAPQADWMEWQAGYVCGSILMPLNVVKGIATEIIRKSGYGGAAVTGSELAERLIHAAAARFDVSRDAARVRLVQLGFVVDGDLRQQRLA